MGALDWKRSSMSADTLGLDLLLFLLLLEERRCSQTLLLFLVLLRRTFRGYVLNRMERKTNVLIDQYYFNICPTHLFTAMGKCADVRIRVVAILHMLTQYAEKNGNNIKSIYTVCGTHFNDKIMLVSICWKGSWPQCYTKDNIYMQDTLQHIK